MGARLTGSPRSGDRSHSHHVIVVGLGQAGTRIAGQLHDLGLDVVCVDKSENAAGIGLARRLRMGVVIGESHLEGTLRAAGVTTCRISRGVPYMAAPRSRRRCSNTRCCGPSRWDGMCC